jgi:diadenosine tetraphosphate (Ap4A) HIT family hydrolase
MCVFCKLEASVKLLENDHFFMIRDQRPVSRGHSLIISKRHVETFFELSESEVICLHQLCQEAKALLDDQHQPSGYNLAINHGRSAGQTVFHFHLHLIPRYG